jgi:hypothetical protein
VGPSVRKSNKRFIHSFIHIWLRIQIQCILITRSATPLSLSLKKFQPFWLIRLQYSSRKEWSKVTVLNPSTTGRYCLESDEANFSSFPDRRKLNRCSLRLQEQLGFFYNKNKNNGVSWHRSVLMRFVCLVKFDISSKTYGTGMAPLFYHHHEVN